MSDERWHHQFDPQRFLRNVYLDKLVARCSTLHEEQAFESASKCLLCPRLASRGLVLNDGTRICADCFELVSRVSYPELYEARHRQYLEHVEARRLAWLAFAGQHKKSEPSITFGVLAVLSLGLLYFDTALIAVSALFAAGHALYWPVQKARHQRWLAKKAEWESAYPPPTEPQLLHFHDPLAQLTPRDKVILKVFSHWPGYPPFWNYLRGVVLKRDRNRCQVTGCPSRVSLHVHHKLSVSRGGAHTPDNLVTLCDFHHGLEPTEGHERVWGAIKTRYFTLVREHKRGNRKTVGAHEVRAHLRRLELVSIKDIEAIDNYHSFLCRKCRQPGLTFRLSANGSAVRVSCRTCNEDWEGARQLAEETGPRLAELLSVGRYGGTWPARWDMLATRTDSAFRSLTAGGTPASGSKRAGKTPRRREVRVCPLCGSPMRLVRPRPGQTWKAFWGCSQYGSTGCRGSCSAGEK